MKHLDHEFRRYLEREVELTPEEIKLASPNEIFDQVLAYEGHGQYAGFAIRRWVSLIYDVDLDDLSLHALMHDHTREEEG